MGLPGKGKRVRVVRTPQETPVEPLETPTPVEEPEPVKVGA